MRVFFYTINISKGGTMNLQDMKTFFKERVEGYDAHMIETVAGCAEGYEMMARFIPSDTKSLLDLGCGTGLQLSGILKKIPDIQVTGVDLSRDMLEKLKEKYKGYAIELIEGSYFDVALGNNKYHASISFQTMHHFKKDKKLALYKRIYDALKVGGVYIECDYMLDDQHTEDFHFNIIDTYRKEHHIEESVFLHYDTPCTVENQMSLLEAAGFEQVTLLWEEGQTKMIRGIKAQTT